MSVSNLSAIYMYYRVSDNCLENLGSVDFLLATTIFKGNLDTSLDNRINIEIYTSYTGADRMFIHTGN